MRGATIPNCGWIRASQLPAAKRPCATRRLKADDQIGSFAAWMDVQWNVLYILGSSISFVLIELPVIPLSLIINAFICGPSVRDSYKTMAEFSSWPFQKPHEYYSSFEKRPHLCEKFHDIDEETHFQSCLHQLGSLQTQNFVLDFGNEDAWCGVNLEREDIASLLRSPVCVVVWL